MSYEFKKPLPPLTSSSITNKFGLLTSQIIHKKPLKKTRRSSITLISIDKIEPIANLNIQILLSINENSSFDDQSQTK
ncbi:unnamed protein product [Rotaria sordida]|uniref:Uncharacterized protein n=1 Tax=Rotaria sordida TaxID=392033 RepID=A0A815UGN6_9BILA|nr:unnamed protein product [Rotaria sordida]